MNWGLTTRAVGLARPAGQQEHADAAMSQKNGREAVTPRPFGLTDAAEGRPYLPTGIATPTFRRKPVSDAPLKNTTGKSI